MTPSPSHYSDHSRGQLARSAPTPSSRPSPAATSNYTFSTINGTTDSHAESLSLVINVNSAARLYGAPNPAFSGTVTGVLPGDNVVVTYTTTATPTSNAGSYPIGANVSGTSAGNYIATIHPGTLAITPAATVTAVATSGSPASAGTNVTFTANVTATPYRGRHRPVNFSDGTVCSAPGHSTAAVSPPSPPRLP